MHLGLFKTQATKQNREQYKQALLETGNERARWDHAFAVGYEKQARTADYVITTARNAEPKDWGAIETDWSPEQIAAAAALKPKP